MSIVGRIREGGSAFPPIKWGDVPGQWVVGTILRVAERQLRDIDGDPETWDDGTARKTPILEIDVVDGSDPDVRGTMCLYARGNVFSALRKALAEAPWVESDEDLIGALIRVELKGRAPAKKGTARKLFTVELEPGDRL